MFAIFIILFQLSFSYYKSHDNISIPDVKFISHNSDNIEIKTFNPNDYDNEDWKRLGFSERQIQTILKYKDILGGTFQSKEQLRKCYAFNDENYSKIEAYIDLPETIDKSSKFESKFKKLNIKQKFNPDHYHQKDWVALGYSEKQALNIIKYKNYLGGSFISKEKFKECYMISEEDFRQLTSFLLLPEKTPTQLNNYPIKQKAIVYQKFNPNDLDLNGWQKLGFTSKQAESILKYKEKVLKGNFRTSDDLKNCFMISEDQYNQIKHYVVLNESKSVEKSSQKTETDFSKMDLNKINFKQLKEFGFDDRAAASYLNFRKKLGGFITKEQILQTYNLDPTLAEKLVNVAYLDTSSIIKYELSKAPEEWLKEHPYFKYSAEKIIQLRRDYPNDADIWKNLKVKSEYEQRMKLYLK